MKSFKQYLEEAASRTKFGQHAKLIGMQPGIMPRAGRGWTRGTPTPWKMSHVHGWLHPDGTFYDAGDKQHLGTAKQLVKLMPQSRQGSSGETDNFLKDKEHIEKVIKHHKVAQIGAFGNFLSVSSHHPLTAAQSRFLKDAVFNKGYDQVERKHKGEFHTALSKRKKSYVADVMKAISSDPASNYGN